MSEDLIRREDAIETAYQLRHKPNDEEWGDWLKSFNAIPSADRPQGEWIEHIGGISHELYYFCDQCYGEVDTNDYDYCPYCGAKMKGADDE